MDYHSHPRIRPSFNTFFFFFFDVKLHLSKEQTFFCFYLFISFTMIVVLLLLRFNVIVQFAESRIFEFDHPAFAF